MSSLKTVKGALNYPGWHDIMLEEIHGLDENHTWSLMDLRGKKAIGCKWAFAVKVNRDGSVARFKARFLAYDYA